MASTITGNNYFSKSMNSIIEIDDGAGSTISDGVITTNTISTNNFNTTNLSCNNVDASSGTITNLNSNNADIYTISNLANVFSNNINYWKIAGIIMKHYYSGPSNHAWFSMNYDDNSGLERNGLQFEVGSNAVMQTIDDDLPYQIYANGIKQLEMTNATGWTFGNTINSTTINNSGTTTTNILSCSTANITNATITNSITVPSISTTNASLQNIQPIVNSTDTNLYTNSTATVNIGGSGNITIGNASTPTITLNGNLTYINKFGNYGIETSCGSSNALLDFHSSNTASDYDTRIISSGGTATTGQGTLELIGNNIKLSSTGSVIINGTGNSPVQIGNSTSTGVMDIYGSTINLYTAFSTGKVFMAKNGNYSVEAGINTTTSYLDFHSSNTSSDYDTRIISTGGTATAGQGTLNLQANVIQLNSNPFRFVPWTTSYSGSSISTIVSASAGLAPTSHATLSLVKYRYSIVGNTMYINYYFNQTGAGTAGGGACLYSIPALATYYINSTDIQASSLGTNGNNGTKVGNCDFKYFGNNNSLGGVYVYGTGAGARLILWSETFNYNIQSNTTYNYGTPALYVAFEAMIPILP